MSGPLSFSFPLRLCAGESVSLSRVSSLTCVDVCCSFAWLPSGVDDALRDAVAAGVLSEAEAAARREAMALSTEVADVVRLGPAALVSAAVGVFVAQGLAHVHPGRVSLDACCDVTLSWASRAGEGVSVRAGVDALEIRHWRCSVDRARLGAVMLAEARGVLTAEEAAGKRAECAKFAGSSASISLEDLAQRPQSLTWRLAALTKTTWTKCEGW